MRPTAPLLPLAIGRNRYMKLARRLHLSQIEGFAPLYELVPRHGWIIRERHRYGKRRKKK